MTEKLPDVMTDSEWKAFLSTFNTRCLTGLRNAAIVALMHDAGLRTCEVLGLKTTDIRREVNTTALDLHVAKGGKERRVYLTEQAEDLMNRWLDARKAKGLGRAKHVFTTLNGEPLKDAYLRELVARKGEDAGIEWRVHPHALRHTFATELLDETGSLALVQDALGHARPETTRVYAKVANGALRDAMTGRNKREDRMAEDLDPETLALAKALQDLSPEQREAIRMALDRGSV